MKLKEFISWVSFLLWATVLSVPRSIAQQTTSGSSVVSPSRSSNNKPIAIKPVALSLAQFINGPPKEMKLPGNIAIPSLQISDCKQVIDEKFRPFFIMVYA